MYRSILPQTIAALMLFGFLAQAHADHPTIAFGSEAAGPIGTIPTAPLPASAWSAGFRAEIVKFDRFSDAELKGFAAAGEDDVHSVDRLLNASVSLAYGVTSDFTVSARLPYVDRDHIREGELEDGGPEAHNHGDANGAGDLSVLGQYRFYKGETLDASVIGGVKAPTGKTDVKDGGEKLATEFQPGTGSWDWLLGVSASKNSGRVGLHGNVLFNLTTEGSQNTHIGDAFFYNVGVIYGLSDGERGDHHNHDHSHLKWDVMLELNGEYREKNEIDGEKEDNSGGEVIYLSPGVRVSSSDKWSLFFP